MTLPSQSQPAAGALNARGRPGERPRAAPTKIARHRRIVELLRLTPVHSQVELAALLTAEGVAVTQATLSRDLLELGAVKVRHPDGGLVYAVPGEGGDRTPRGGIEQEM